jgi:hypothetical protein
MKSYIFRFTIIVVLFFGQSSLKAEFVNGGFETGDTIGWSKYGTVEVLHNLGPILPVEGNYFACVSSGPGATVTLGSLNAMPTIPSWATGVVFNWDFLTAEATPSELFNDYGAVCSSVMPSDLHVDTKTPGFIEIQPGGVYTPGGSYFTKRLGWHTYFIDISPIKGRLSELNLTVYGGDTGAADIDSAMLVDNFHFVPEPTTLLLLGLGAVMLRRKC